MSSLACAKFFMTLFWGVPTPPCIVSVPVLRAGLPVPYPYSLQKVTFFRLHVVDANGDLHTYKAGDSGS